MGSYETPELVRRNDGCVSGCFATSSSKGNAHAAATYWPTFINWGFVNIDSTHFGKIGTTHLEVRDQILLLRLPDLRVRDPRRVEKHHFRLAHLLLHLFQNPSQSNVITHVDGKCLNLDFALPCRGDFFGFFFKALQVAREQGYIEAFRGEEPGGRQADAGAGADDDEEFGHF
jgi:hypothetical protein